MSEFPNFYDPDRIGTLFYPDVNEIAAAAVGRNFRPAKTDMLKVHLLIIDMQVDFCHPTGSLYVPGAEEDIRRLIEFIYRNGDQISKITCTLDSHLPFQIFHPPWWIDEDGNHPEPMTIITHEDVKEGRWRPIVMPGYSRNYVQKLEEQAKKQLLIWPFHVMIGGPGNMLDPELWSAVIWHSMARRTQPVWLAKGTVPQSEYYSAVAPEIEVPEHPQGSKNERFVRNLANSDILVIAGEAESHCVLETLEDIVAEFKETPEKLEQIYVLQDCTSPVQHPDVDFHALAQEQFAEFAEMGVNFVNSTDDLPFLASAEDVDEETAVPTPTT